MKTPARGVLNTTTKEGHHIQLPNTADRDGRPHVSIQNLISTSVSDCKITLEGDLRRDPVAALRTAIDLLEELKGMEGQSSRRQVAASILTKAVKELKKEPNR